MEEPEQKTPAQAEPHPPAATSLSTKTAQKTPSKTAKASPRKKPHKAKGVARPPRKFPANTLEDALQVPRAIKQFNAGNPWPPSEIAKASKIGPKTDRFWYLTAAARDYGLTVGTSRSELIELAPIGRSIVYAPTPEIEAKGIRDAFFTVEAFKKVFDYYKGGILPEVKYLANTLESVFNLPPSTHEEFHSLYVRNCTFVSSFRAAPADSATSAGDGAETPHSIIIGAPSTKTSLTAFVIMPFVEKTEQYPHGFFEEVLKNLITPAAVEAGFRVETAKREGSDVIQSTIVNDLLGADLVIADLTEHNPNVLFELGLRMAFEKPIALIRARGTPPIFDVDNLLRVLDYDPSLWKSTLEGDIPKMSGHVKGAWEQRDTAMTYMKLLKRK